MSNFIDEVERHAELFRRYSPRQQDVLDTVQALRQAVGQGDELTVDLRSLGVSDAEIRWLKRTGHYLPRFM